MLDEIVGTFESRRERGRFWGARNTLPERSGARLFFMEWNADATNNLREAWITSEGIESGIHPDKGHSKRPLLETFFERGESSVGFSEGGIYRGNVVAANKPFLRHSQKFLENLARFFLIS